METGDVAITLGEARGIIAPLGSATAGSKWLETTVTYVNTSDKPIRIDGYAPDHPFYGIETRASPNRDWVQYDLMFCGFGAGEYEIAPGNSNSFKAALPEEYAGHEIRVSLLYRTTRANGGLGKSFSEVRQLAR